MKNFLIYLFILIFGVFAVNIAGKLFVGYSILTSFPELYVVIPSFLGVPAGWFLSKHLDIFSKIALLLLSISTIFGVYRFFNTLETVSGSEIVPLDISIPILAIVLLLSTWCNFRTIIDKLTGAYYPS